MTNAWMQHLSPSSVLSCPSRVVACEWRRWVCVSIDVSTKNEGDSLLVTVESLLPSSVTLYSYLDTPENHLFAPPEVNT